MVYHNSKLIRKKLRDPADLTGSQLKRILIKAGAI
jgi:hypothetical protein